MSRYNEMEHVANILGRKCHVETRDGNCRNEVVERIETSIIKHTDYAGKKYEIHIPLDLVFQGDVGDIISFTAVKSIDSGKKKAGRPGKK